VDKDVRVSERIVNRLLHNHTKEDKKLVRAWLADNVSNPYLDAETMEFFRQRSNLTHAQFCTFLINERKRSPLLKDRPRGHNKSTAS